MDGMGEKEYYLYMAYVYVSESEVKRYRQDCSKVLKDVCAQLKNKNISAQFTLIGSGARNMVTRNGNGPYDLDYNLMIIKAPNEYLQHPEKLKDIVRVALNKAERCECFSDAQDSTSCLTAILYFVDSPQIEFSFDVAIISKNRNGNIQRLIHNKNVLGLTDQYIWNESPNSHDVGEKAYRLKCEGKWKEVRDRYLIKKNMYLGRNDKDHPSFVVYIEAVNEVYNRYFPSIISYSGPFLMG